MGHQVNFLTLPTDLQTMDAAIRATGDVCFLEDRTPRAKPIELDRLAFAPSEMGWRPLRAYVVRRADLSAVTTTFVPGPGYWVIDSGSSPVISSTGVSSTAPCCDEAGPTSPPT